MKNFLIFAILFTFSGMAYAVEPSPAQTPPQAQTYATYQSCLRQYQMPSEKLYYLALGAINFNKYEILEMQSRNGYILFEYNSKEFLVSIMTKDNKTSFIKITPADNNYAFPVAIPQKIFSQIDINFNTTVQEIR